MGLFYALGKDNPFTTLTTLQVVRYSVVFSSGQ
jgi:hypothetical protein